ncbi:MAG: flagellar motor stator protein MotA [Bdellovibrionales bacterium CG10_big_fil_rev_8_21_14_0_10_45_34]|nr:MAG: flagellar motor stator protein MotA [Bdellovibrionales bacterium CG10_big_fil_rev_8_21_14_0_10_45_34]
MGAVGLIVVLVMVFGGFILHGGNMRVIMQPTEVMIIFGAALGAAIIQAPMSSLKASVKYSIRAMVGSSGPSSKEYLDLLQLLYRLFQTFRKDGPQGVEKHIEEPQGSEIFKAYPSFLKNHHAVHLLCDTMKITLSADLTQYDVDDLLDLDIKTGHEEEHDAQHIVANTADAMPGLGIVAAVLGVVITMGKLDQGTEVIGHSVAAALVGTFMGVMAAYGFFSPLAGKIGRNIEADGRYLRCIKVALVALQRGNPPLVCVEYARRSIFPDQRPSFDEMDKALKEKKAA